MTKNRLYLLIGISCLAGYSWVFFSYYHVQQQAVNVCLIKHVTGFACPSCGSTRAILKLIDGDIIGSLTLNPIGLLLALIMCFSPIWILFDLLFNKSSVLKFYTRMEQFLKKKRVALFFVFLIVGNWIWNIAKGM